MEPTNPETARLPVQSAILLVFMPSERPDRQQRTLTTLTDSLQAHLGSLLRILRIDEANNPDVMRSFAVTRTPAFVLVRQGVELWRQEGLSDEAALVGLIQDLLTQKAR